MLEATRMLLRFSFEELVLHRVEADVDPRIDTVGLDPGDQSLKGEGV